MIGQTISHYRILEHIGSGGMGEVWKAEDVKLSRHVALKFLAAHLLSDPEIHKRFEREAKAAARLSHPNICTIHEIDEAEGKTFLAMELVEGESLEAPIGKGPLPLREALDIALQVAEGLREAHAKGVVHRDIKPGNILITAGGRVKILDFGLALLTEGSKLTKLDTTLGTVAYMSPEQTQASGTDHRTDIWSLGVVLYEMVTGQRPFRGDYDKAIMYSILNEGHEPITGVRAGVPMELETSVSKCLAKDPGKRYQSAGELVIDLSSIGDKFKSDRSTVLLRSKQGSTATAHPAAVTVKSQRLPWAIAVFFLVAAILFGLGYVRETSTDGPRVPLRRFSYTPAEGVHEAYLSWDGRYIAYTAGEDRQLWIQGLDEHEPRKIEGVTRAECLCWSPDSQDIAFISGSELRRVGVHGGASRALCRMPNMPCESSTWSPDGESVVLAGGAWAGSTKSPLEAGLPNT